MITGASFAIYTLSALRMGVGVALLGIPNLTAQAFLMPSLPNASIAYRMAGSRDLAVGGLLYAVMKSASTRNHSKTLDDTSGQNEAVDRLDPTNPLLKPTSHAGPLQTNLQDDLRRALLTGVFVDAVDLASCLICYEQGFLPSGPALLIGGGASIFLSLGVFGLSKLAVRN